MRTLIHLVMKHNNDFDKIFTQWGRSQRSLPTKSEQIKHTVLSALTESSVSTRRLPMHMAQPWLSYAFTALAVFMLFVNFAASPKDTPAVSTMSAPESTSVGGAPAAIPSPMNFSAQDAVLENSTRAYKGVEPDYAPMPPIYYGGDVPVTDDREFLKTDYNATIQTRDVNELARELETKIRGYDGRIDSFSSSEKFGNISFALPANKLDTFRQDIESMVASKFLTVNIRQENLLPQKQSIEQQKEYVEKTLADLKTQRSKLVSTHNSTVAALKARLDAIKYELSVLSADQTTDPIRRQQIAARQYELLTEQGSLENRISGENSSYASELKYLDARISGAQDGLVQVNKSDQNLLDNVATVRGNISLNWISVWEVIKLYVPPGWMAAIFIAAAIVSYFVQKKRGKLASAY